MPSSWISLPSGVQPRLILVEIVEARQQRLAQVREPTQKKLTLVPRRLRIFGHASPLREPLGPRRGSARYVRR